jgi:hypothetical protein
MGRIPVRAANPRFRARPVEDLNPDNRFQPGQSGSDISDGGQCARDEPGK